MRRTFIWHPLLFSLFPVLFLYSRNMSEFPVSVVVAPAAVAGGFAAAAWLLLHRLLRNARKAALIVSVFLVLFSSYGYVLSALYRLPVSFERFHYGAASIFFPLCVLAFVSCFYCTVRSRSGLGVLTATLNVTATALVVMSLATIGSYEIRNRGSSQFTFDGAVTEDAGEDQAGSGGLPNIYYIILDAYGREDNLRGLYGFDNGPVVRFLRSRGFYVADGSRTNYSHTALSLASSLNFEYLDGLAAQIGEGTDDRQPLRRMIAASRVRRFLEGKGYRFVSIMSGYQATEIRDADVYLTAGQRGEFERALINSTAASAVEALLGRNFTASARSLRERDRERVLFAFGKLPETARYDGPAFVFAHIIAPHPPFVFARDGGRIASGRYYGLKSADHLIREGGITRGEYIDAYCEQLAFVNTLLMDAVDSILSLSSIPPVIIIEGDHGPGAFLHHNNLAGTYLGDRMGILMALHLPHGTDGLLYDTITPVNTFRLVFNRYFGCSFELLPDESYYSTVLKPYRFIRVTDMIESEEDKRRLEILQCRDYYPDGIVAGAHRTAAPGR